MRVLIVDGDATALQSIAAALRGAFVVDAVTNKADCLLLLRQSEFRVIVACERTADGSGLDLLGRVSRECPQVLRIFAAEPARLAALRLRLEPFKLFQTISYPIDPANLRTLLNLARAADEAQVDTADVQHIVLTSDVAPLEDAADSTPAPPPPVAVLAGPAPGSHAAVTRIIDDEQILILTREFALREACVAALKSHPGPVTPMATILATSRALREAPTAMVVVDLAAIGEDPLPFFSEVRSRSPRTAVVAIGEAAHGPKLQSLVARGALHRFLQKPLRAAALRGALESALRQAAVGDLVLRDPPPARGTAVTENLANASRAAAAALNEQIYRKSSADTSAWLVPAASVAVVALAALLLLLAWRSSTVSERAAPPPIEEPVAQAPPSRPSREQQVAATVVRLEQALTREDPLAISASLRELRRLAPDHPRLPLFEALARRVLEPAPSAPTGPGAIVPGASTSATLQGARLPGSTIATAGAPAVATPSVPATRPLQPVSFPGRTLEDTSTQVSPRDGAPGVSATKPANDSPGSSADTAAAPRLLRRVAPQYPESAARAGIEGHVEVEFKVAPDGRTEDVRAIGGSPSGVFDSAAVAAVRRWRYEPGPGTSGRVRARIGFELDR